MFDGGDLYLGLLDCLLAFGVALANSGVMTRQQIADAMETVIRQQRRNEGDAHPGRHLAAETLRQVFSIPVRDGSPFAIIEGGKPDEPKS